MEKMKTPKMTLARYLIGQINKNAYRAGSLKGMKHTKIDSAVFEIVGGRSALVEQADRLKREGLLQFTKEDLGADIREIHYSVDIMPVLCEREGIEDPRHRQKRYIRRTEEWRARAEGTWLTPYYERNLNRLEKGDEVKSVDFDDEPFFRCLNSVLYLEKPVWRRVFSAMVFGKTKTFEQEYQSRVLSVLRQYSPFYEEGMTDEELLKVHGILTYSQTLEWKGPLRYQMGAGPSVDTSNARYGTVVNAQTLEHAVPEALPDVKRVLVIENKTNYEDMEYRPDTLYLFCHGFFSPKEIAFLKGIAAVAEEGTEYFHWGDMDLGGIRIFQFNKKNIFPGLKPYKMDRETFYRALSQGAGIPLDDTVKNRKKGDSKRERLEKLDAGELEELKSCILESGMEIEQEILLASCLKKV